MKDFIHKTLINAGGKDAVSNMLTGAAMGAGANTALGIVQGDFDVIGNATSGALLGAGGGAALRHAGDKYTAGLAKMGKDAPSEFKFSTFSNAEKDSLNFMGSEEGLKRAQAMASNIPSSKGATTNAPQTAQPSSADPKMSDKFKDRPGHIVDNGDVYKATGNTKDMTMPSFTTFDTFGRPNTTGGGTAKMDMHRKLTETEQKNALRADEIRAEKKAAAQAQAAKNPVQMGSSVDSSYSPKSLKEINPAGAQKTADINAAKRMQEAQARNDKTGKPTQEQMDKFAYKKEADAMAKQRMEDANQRFMDSRPGAVSPLSGNPVTSSQKDLLAEIKKSNMSIKDFNAQKKAQASAPKTQNKKSKKGNK